MKNTSQVSVQKQGSKPKTMEVRERRTISVESLIRKAVLAALTMLGIGYVLVNAPMALLIGNSLVTTPIVSQVNVTAIAGRILFLMASVISALLGCVFIFGAVQFYERGQTRGIVFLGVMFGALYLLCLGVGSLLLSEINLTSLMWVVAPILIAVSAASYTSTRTSFRLVGSALGILGGVLLAYGIFNLQVFDLVFPWGIPFTGPFMSFTVLESVVVVLAPVAVSVNSFFDKGGLEERPLAHTFVLLVALVYGVSALIGSIILSMSFWNYIWKSPWVGPFLAVPEWIMSTIVFWSASLVLIDIGGLLLIAAACLGFIYVTREFSQT